MEKITNTTKDSSVLLEFNGKSVAIELQEVAGKRELINSSQLPSQLNAWGRPSPIDQYVLMGIKVKGVSEGDDKFLDVELPKGWKICATQHPLWCNLVDDKGRTRAEIFYKAAYYDRDAFITFNTRYQSHGNFEDSIKTTFIVKDLATNKVLFETKEIHREYISALKNSPERVNLYDNYVRGEIKARKECEQYLQDNFPKHEDINAYWD